jgi:hypothetical protein
MESEVWAMVRSLPPDKVPGPDGFTARFLQAAWPVIKGDIKCAFNAFWYLYSRNFHIVNHALMTLLPKIADASTVRDYRPISLIHVLGKLFSKVLTDRLAPWLLEFVQINQSAFIKGRSIQDNFLLLQESARLLHAHRRPSLLLKIDIARAFDSVVWSFLLEILQHMGFSRRWREWISIILSSASTRILLNGNPGHRICHTWGLRHGDPLSHMIFLLVMEVLNGLLQMADEWSLL